MSGERPTSRLPYVLFGTYLAVALLAVTWPGFAWLGARIEPRVLGLPFCFAWTVAWVLATFVAMVLFHLAVSRRR